MPDRCHVYILASQRNGTLNVGVISNLAGQIAAHKAKAVPGFTKQYNVHMLVHVEEYTSIHEARAREHALKRWRRVWKLELIEKDNPTWKDLSGEL